MIIPSLLASLAPSLAVTKIISAIGKLMGNTPVSSSPVASPGMSMEKLANVFQTSPRAAQLMSVLNPPPSTMDSINASSAISSKLLAARPSLEDMTSTYMSKLLQSSSMEESPRQQFARQRPSGG